MLVRMETNVLPEHRRVELVVEKALQFGLKADVRRTSGTHHSLVEIYLLDGEKTRSCTVSSHIFEGMEGVAEVVRITPAEVSLAAHTAADPIRIPIGPELFIGKGLPCQLIAGPCTVDQHVHSIVRNLRDLGVKLIRGGCWKPRSNAHSFRGFGKEGLQWLLEAARDNDITAVFTEILESDQIDDVRFVRDRVHYEGTVVLWVGARNIGNTRLLASLGCQKDFPVMLKNGIHHRRVQELFDAAGFVLAGPKQWDADGKLVAEESMESGNHNLMLCMRGTEKVDPDSPMRFNPNHSWIKTIHDRSWAPVGIDPSHSAGTMRDDLVLTNLQSAMAYKPDFVLLEGGYPEAIRHKGMCDVEQSVPLERLRDIIAMIQLHNRINYGDTLPSGGWSID